jgi:predicted membrane protein
MGINVLRGFSQPKERCMNCACAVDVFFDDEFVQTHEGPYEYSTIFGKSVIDLSKLTQATSEHPIEIKIDTIFGKTDVRLNRSIPVSIKATAAFAKTDFPDETVIAFGSRAYSSSHEEPRIIITTSTVFGETNFSYKN